MLEKTWCLGPIYLLQIPLTLFSLCHSPTVAPLSGHEKAKGDCGKSQNSAYLAQYTFFSSVALVFILPMAIPKHPWLSCHCLLESHLISYSSEM